MKISIEEHTVLSQIIDAGLVGYTAKQRAEYLEQTDVILRGMRRDSMTILDALTNIFVSITGENPPKKVPYFPQGAPRSADRAVKN